MFGNVTVFQMMSLAGVLSNKEQNRVANVSLNFDSIKLLASTQVKEYNTVDMPVVNGPRFFNE